jgi:transposase-like protein
MAKKTYQIKPSIRYSQAFKMEVVRELESSGKPFDHIRRKYGLGVSTVQYWVNKYGNGTRGRMIRVEKPQEIDEKKRMKDRIRRLEAALADANIELALERAYTEIACERAGIKDVESFKKKADGQPPIKR